jgi:hypothetical protein
MMTELRQLEQRVFALEQKVEGKFNDMDVKLDRVLEVVSLGRTALLFAKAGGWIVAAAAAAIEVYRVITNKG